LIITTGTTFILLLDTVHRFRRNWSIASATCGEEFARRSICPCEILPVITPTLSEWGLIALAGILGIVGFIVIRRRKAAA